MTFLISYRVYMMTGSFHITLFEGTLHVDKIHEWFKIANITHALPIPVYRQTDFTPKRVVHSRLHDTVARNSCPGTTTGVNPCRGDSCRHDILWWYHINKYRVMRGNRRWTRTRAKVALTSCKHPLRLSFLILCSETTRKHLLGRLVESLISSWWIKFFRWRVLLNPFPEGAN